MLLTSDELEEIEVLNCELLVHFEIKWLGKLNYLLGMEVAYFRYNIFLSQLKYILDVLNEVHTSCCQPTIIFIKPNRKLDRGEESPPADQGQYQRLDDKLIYLTHNRLNIVYAVGLLCQFMHDPIEMTNMQYLKGTLGYDILFQYGDSTNLEILIDANYTRSIMDRRSTFGYYSWGT